jgi:6-phosphogluconolactonase
MPVETIDSEAAALGYAETIRNIAGSPAVIDLVHLGLGSDGHTASLLPGDPVLEISNRDVALTGIYNGRCRMTLTYPVINRSRRILWLITGGEKHEMLQRLISGDHSIPAGRVRQDHALILADRRASDGSGQK